MCNSIRGIAQPGSASALGAEGRGFESLCPDQVFFNYVLVSFYPALVAHLDRASAF